jgi:hypothetical protein
MLETTPTLVMNFFIQKTFFAASDVEMYFASIVEFDVVSCLKLF